MKRFLAVSILLLSFCGIALTSYLSQSEGNGAPLICNVESLSDCNEVVLSPYSRIFGISLSDFGFLFYVILFVIAAFELVLYDAILRRALQIFSLFGIAVSVYSVYLQTLVIQRLCIYCLASAFITLAVLILASMIEPLRKGDTRLLPVTV